MAQGILRVRYNHIVEKANNSQITFTVLLTLQPKLPKEAGNSPHVKIRVKNERQGFKAAGYRIDKGHREPRQETRGMNTTGVEVNFQGLQWEMKQ